MGGTTRSNRLLPLQLLSLQKQLHDWSYMKHKTDMWAKQPIDECICGKSEKKMQVSLRRTRYTAGMIWGGTAIAGITFIFSPVLGLSYAQVWEIAWHQEGLIITIALIWFSFFPYQVIRRIFMQQSF